MPTEFGPHNLTSNTAPAPFVASASSFYSSGDDFFPFRAFDGTADYWAGQNAGVDWLQLDFGVGNYAFLDSYSIHVNTIPEPARAPNTWQLQGSRDGSAWDTLDTRTGETAWASGETRTYTCAVTGTSYRYFRLSITANNGDATYTQVAELSLFGTAPPPLPVKPAAGTRVAANALTDGMVMAYLLNGSLATTLIDGQNVTGLLNSVDGASPLTTTNVSSGALSYDSVTDSLVFTGADSLGVPGGPSLGSPAGLTLIIGFLGDAAATFNCVWQMQQASDQDFMPYSNGHVLSAALSSSRGDYVPPATPWFNAFNQVAVSAAAGGNLLSYINGVLADTRAADATLSIPATAQIGTSFSKFVGKIQFFYAWGRVLTAAEIASVAANPYASIFTGGLAPLPEIGPHDLTSNTSHAPFVVSASGEFYPAWKAFDGQGWDGNPVNSWLTTALPGWIELAVGRNALLQRYAIQVPGQENGWTPNTWELQGSINGSIWTTLDSRAGETAWTPGETRYFDVDFSSGATYISFRLYVTAGNGVPGFEGYIQVSELFLYGTVGALLAGQTITFPPITGHDAASDTDLGFDPGASSDSGLPITYNVTGPATITGRLLFITGVGDITVTANQEGDAGYLYATPVSQTFTVTSFSVTVDPPDPDNPPQDIAGAWLTILEPSAPGGAIVLSDRSAYLYEGDGASHTFTLQLRQRGQASIPLIIAADDPYMPTLGTLCKLYDRLKPLPPAPGRTSVSATLFVTYSFTNGGSPEQLAVADFTLGAVGILTFNPPWHTDTAEQNGLTVSHVLSTDEFAQLVAGTLNQNFSVDGSLFFDNVPPSVLKIIDVWIEVLYDDESSTLWLPLRATVFKGSTPATDGVVDASSALDYDPSTAAKLTRSHFSSLGFAWILQVSLFSDTTFGTQDDPVFVGTIDTIEINWLGDNGDRIVTLTLVSLEQVFDTLLIPPRLYKDQTAGDIVKDIFASVCQGIEVSPGFTVSVPLTLAADIADGPIVPTLLCNWDRVSDIFDKLAGLAKFVWGVLPALQQMYFKDPSTTPALRQDGTAWLLESSDGMWEAWNWKQERHDFRDWQGVRVSTDAFEPSGEFFVGAGQKDFTLRQPAAAVTAAFATLSTPNTAIMTFNALPVDGDTFTTGPFGEVWQASHIYAVGGIIIDAAGNVQKITAVTGDGTSGTTYPVFSEVATETTIDLNVTWTCEGPLGLATNSQTYTFVDVLDNTQFGQILIGSSIATAAYNTVQALNGNDSGPEIGAGVQRGVSYSMPTWENAYVNALDLASGGNSITLQQKKAGTGWITTLASSTSAVSFDGPTTAGGTSPNGSLGPGEGATISLNIGIAGTSVDGPGLVYTPGLATFSLVTPLNVGSNLNVAYRRAGGDLIIVKDSALIAARSLVESGAGLYQVILDDSSNISAADGLLEAQQALSAFKVLPVTFQFSTLKRGLTPGQLLTFAIAGPGHDPANPGHAPTLGNRSWAVQEVDAELIPVKPWMPMAGCGHYRYTVRVVDSDQMSDYLDFWNA